MKKTILFIVLSLICSNGFSQSYFPLSYPDLFYLTSHDFYEADSYVKTKGYYPAPLKNEEDRTTWRWKTKKTASKESTLLFKSRNNGLNTVTLITQDASIYQNLRAFCEVENFEMVSNETSNSGYKNQVLYRNLNCDIMLTKEVTTEFDIYSILIAINE